MTRLPEAGHRSDDAAPESPESRSARRTRRARIAAAAARIRQPAIWRRWRRLKESLGQPVAPTEAEVEDTLGPSRPPVERPMPLVDADHDRCPLAFATTVPASAQPPVQALDAREPMTARLGTTPFVRRDPRFRSGSTRPPASVLVSLASLKR